MPRLDCPSVSAETSKRNKMAGLCFSGFGRGVRADIVLACGCCYNAISSQVGIAILEELLSNPTPEARSRA